MDPFSQLQQTSILKTMLYLVPVLVDYTISWEGDYMYGQKSAIIILSLALSITCGCASTSCRKDYKQTCFKTSPVNKDLTKEQGSKLKLIAINSASDVPSEYKNTPIEKLLQYHNLKRKLSPHKKPELLLGMCMDDRLQILLPKNFAYVIRTGGGNLRYNEFQISYAIAIGGITSIALVGHDDCGMVNLAAKKEKFINGLVNKAGWDKKSAEEHFAACSPMFELTDAVGFTFLEAKRLKAKYPKITVVPMLYKVEDNHLYLITE